MLDIEHGIELRFIRDLVSIDQQKVWGFHSLVIFTTFIYYLNSRQCRHRNYYDIHCAWIQIKSEFTIKLRFHLYQQINHLSKNQDQQKLRK